MKKNIILPFLIIISALNFLYAQENNDSVSLTSFLKKGNFNLHFRTFFMSTVNEGPLKDDAALAAGAGIRYASPEWKGFSIAIGGYLIYKIASTDLTKKDSITGQRNRYEIGLFDITNFKKQNEMDRMEELYLRYRIKRTYLTFGKQFIHSPFINKQDGRMRPTAVGGLWIRSSFKKNWIVDAGWLKRISPRTTLSWYSIGESIGIYSAGVNPDGTKSGYPGNTMTKAILINGIQYKNGLFHTQFWNTHVENIMNTLFLQQELGFALNQKKKFIVGLQYMYQGATGNGGNPDTSKTYYSPDNHTWIIASRLGFEDEQWKSNLNFIHISKDGRFLMPREWGREPFYTFLPRERNEGLGNVNAFTLNNEFVSKNKNWKLTLGYGRYYLPLITNFRLNKYGMPSYQQINLQANHQFTGFLKNLDLELLLAWKGKIENQVLAPGNIINKVNMLNTNLIVNYHF